MDIYAEVISYTAMSSNFINTLYRSCVFYSGRIRTLVAMATYSFHRLIMGNVEIDYFCQVIGDI